MKYLITFCLLSLFILACDPKPIGETDNETTSTIADPVQEQQGDGLTIEKLAVDSITGEVFKAAKPIGALSSAIGPVPKAVVDPIPPKLTPPNPQTEQEKRVNQTLSTEIWVVWSLVRIKKQSETRANQGTWFKFNPDGTYAYGFWDQPIGNGTWYFDGPNGLLNMDANLKSDDRQWKLQMASTEDVMVWTGTEKFHTTDITLKLHRFYNVPKTRAELGVTE